MKTFSLFVLSFAGLCGAMAAQQFEDVKIPRPPVVGNGVKTVDVLPPKQVAPNSYASPAPVVPAAQKPQSTPAGDQLSPFAADPDLVVFDYLPNGSHWAASGSYKAEFAVDAVRFVPFLGADAPDSYPVAFRLRGIELAGQALPLATKVPARRTEHRLWYDRGGAVELYDVRGRNMEQMFRFDFLPGRGEIVVTVDVDTDLKFTGGGEGFRFENARGGVSYGKAFAVDAIGERLELATRYEHGQIEIRVPAAFVSAAVLPLTIDPIVGPFQTISSQQMILHTPDIAFDNSTGRYLYVWNEVRSATDSDVYCAEYDTVGNPRGGVVSIDQSVQSWQYPKVANNNLADRNLVVAQVSTNSASPYWIAGRTRNAGASTTGAPFTIADATWVNHESGDKIHPDVAGDFYDRGPTYFTVVWERVYNASDHDIHMKQVTNDLNPQYRSAAPTLIDDSGSSYASHPAISKSGGPGPAAMQSWVIVYQRTVGPADEDIFYALTTWDGNIAQSYRVLDASPRSDNEPDVSSPAGEYGTQPRFWMATYSRGFSTANWDIVASVGDESGATRAVGVNLTQLETWSTPHPWRQRYSAVATDGCRFVVAYTEDYQNSGDLDIRASTFYFHSGNNTVGINESRVGMATVAPDVEANAQIASTYDAGGVALRYGLIWQHGQGGGSYAIEAQQYEGMGPGGVAMIGPGCVPLPIVILGEPALGGEMIISTPGFGLMFGLRRSVPYQCGPCSVLVDGDTFLPNVRFFVPRNVTLLGGVFAVQAFDVAPGMPCMNAVGLSDAYELRIR